MKSLRYRNRGIGAAFWGVVFLVWFALLATYLPGVAAASREPGVTTTAAWAVAGMGLASSVIWFGGIRHLAMWVVSLLPPLRLAPGPLPANARVALLYTTANDFNAEALRTSMEQTYRTTTVILDDSSTSHVRAEIDAFAATHGLEVIRRAEHTGFKAGNLNHGIARLIHRFDYFVIVDSDEVLAPYFVARALGDFSSDPTIGIVQGRHQASASATRFSGLFSGMLESHVAVAQGARSRVGCSVFMGRGAMISAECIRRAGPFPEVVIEDVAMSLETRMAGLEIHYDRELVSREDFPVDYHAFRTQHAKNVEGTTEFLSMSWKRILGSRLRVTEKIDLIVEQTLAPAIGASGLVLLASGLVIASGGGNTVQPLWSIFVTAFFGLAALLPQTVDVARTRGFIRAAIFLAGASALYGSTFIVTLYSALKVLVGGRAVFVVTPKTAQGGSWRFVLSALRLEIAAGVAVVVLALTMSGSLAPAFPVLGPVTLAFGFATVGAWSARESRGSVPTRRAGRTTTGPADTPSTSQVEVWAHYPASR